MLGTSVGGSVNLLSLALPNISLDRNIKKLVGAGCCLAASSGKIDILKHIVGSNYVTIGEQSPKSLAICAGHGGQENVFGWILSQFGLVLGNSYENSRYN